ncbi:MAG: DUF2064 domain-containing protein [Gemmatimonadota bacterium]|nr:DUF2064 domain-containing protein [Gemmatimonadota bacterium]
MSGAVAVWVKTPGLSPLKTRLARTVGTATAEEFYRRSADAVRAVVQRAADDLPGWLTPYWAVAEAESDAWQGFATVRQGSGGLGERLSHVYDTLRARHPWVIFLGADAPQITAGVLKRAGEIAGKGRFVLGPAEDGGFYVFAGGHPIPRAVWRDVAYSDAATLRELERGLRPLAPVDRLATSFDVDNAGELLRLRDELGRQAEILPEQRALAEWLTRSVPASG